MAFQAPNIKELENLLRNYMKAYSHVTKDIETAWDIYRDDYGKPICAVPYLKITLKDDEEIVEDLMNFKGIQVKTSS